ncbi:hypothetical protein COCC4DRAFT_141932 [Bipolaris maydis ATCC 48331]|uniref:Uncharacterized protein n=2 Tax=Cochliobolus heterostrophus TaxID=5016 RepID=M2UTI0_COCH5|nr:uncharacterized protein COCC4DRAFT_141932 [Bipolaris maydis ATCC 48331]EMD96861.1 hypothetical protein COCHEDRAFT_1150538 [Bipolaris maydis C5]ENI03730.1 hypothetical protein COCC4DRAFT_141932 [Bipolaris maydis ATCC 48331]
MLSLEFKLVAGLARRSMVKDESEAVFIHLSEIATSTIASSLLSSGKNSIRGLSPGHE